MAHILSVEVPPIANPKALRIFDSSTWDTSLTVASRKLSITPPGYRQPTIFSVPKGFDRIYNSSLLEMNCATDACDLMNLPDGIYIIRLTVQQGDEEQWDEWNHLRQVCLTKELMKARCSLNMQPCDNLDQDTNTKRKELNLIEDYMKAAKAKVEWCGAPVEGLKLHQYAAQLLEKYNSDPCKTC